MEVGVARIARQSTLEIINPIARAGRAAACCVGEGGNAIDMVELRHAIFIEMGRDPLGNRRRTIHGSQDADVVTRPNLAIGAVIAFKGARGQNSRQGPQITADGGFVAARDKAQIMAVNMGTCLNRLRGLADHRAIFDDGSRCLNPAQRDLVSCSNGLERAEVADAQRVACRQRCQGNADIIGLGQAQNLHSAPSFRTRATTDARAPCCRSASKAVPTAVTNRGSLASLGPKTASSEQSLAAFSNPFWPFWYKARVSAANGSCTS